MRAARILKHWSVVVAFVGVAVSLVSDGPLLVRMAGVIVSLSIGLVLRVAGNLGILCWEWRASNMHQLNQMTRDLEALQANGARHPSPRGAENLRVFQKPLYEDTPSP